MAVLQVRSAALPLPPSAAAPSLSLKWIVGFAMEVAGLAIGVVGLAGLHSTCVELLGQIDSFWTDYIARELHTLHARLCASLVSIRSGLPNSEVRSSSLKLARSRPRSRQRAFVFPIVGVDLHSVDKVCTVSGFSL
jgi:hypothetical protein